MSAPTSVFNRLEVTEADPLMEMRAVVIPNVSSSGACTMQVIVTSSPTQGGTGENVILPTEIQ